MEIYAYNRNYTYTYEEAQCTSHTSGVQVLELPQSYFGSDWEGTLFT